MNSVSKCNKLACVCPKRQHECSGSTLKILDIEYFVHLAVGVSFSSIPEALHCLLNGGSLCLRCGTAHMMSSSTVREAF